MAISVTYHTLTIDRKTVRFPYLVSTTSLSGDYIERNFTNVTTLVRNYTSNQPYISPLTKNVKYSINETQCYIEVTSSGVNLYNENSYRIGSSTFSYGSSCFLLLAKDPD